MVRGRKKERNKKKNGEGGSESKVALIGRIRKEREEKRRDRR